MKIANARWLIASLVIFLRAAQAGEPAPVDAFVGDWVGVGLKEDVTSIAAGQGDYAVRDLDVTIERAETGLNITWTTRWRLDGASEKKSTSMTLIETAPGVFVGTENGDVLKGDTAVWGRIEEQSLIVYVFEVDEAGIYDLARYERTLSTNGRMFLQFRRTRDGTTVRSVNGELVRAP